MLWILGIFAAAFLITYPIVLACLAYFQKRKNRTEDSD